MASRYDLAWIPEIIQMSLKMRRYCTPYWMHLELAAFLGWSSEHPLCPWVGETSRSSSDVNPTDAKVEPIRGD